jgi:hypothetical protein
MRSWQIYLLHVKRNYCRLTIYILTPKLHVCLFVLYLKMLSISSDYIASNEWMEETDKLERVWKEEAVT